MNNILYKRLVLILAVGFLGMALMSSSDSFNKSSLVKVYANKNEYDIINERIESGKMQVENSKAELINLRERAGEVDTEARGVEKKVNIANLEYHLPSILIQLEDIAVKNKLSLEIKHGEIQDFAGGVYNDVSEEDKAKESDDKKAPAKEDEEKEDKKVKDEEKTDKNKDAPIKEENVKDGQDEEKEKEVVKVQKTHEVDQVEVPTVNALTTTVIPIDIKGDYYQVRQFLKDLDDLNFIEPLFANIVSSGEDVSASLKIIVIHR